ncbi:TSUP family transporter [Actimicrobium antarcticum]|uniref:Probable membrane transporter protein n=1 Tax=Actimicrobium antarcticum TaxID=1051899 RepID=A0ABP7T575_9BURK
MEQFALLYVAAFLAGLVDAVVGGGGLIQLPALFSVFPNMAPATLLGTNKLSGFLGTSVAAVSFSRRVNVEWSAALPAAAAAFVFAFAGAFTVTHVPADFIRKLLPFILIGVGAYTLKKKDFGSVHAPYHSGVKERWLAIAIGGGVGFYDGFFGPGTGSFLVFLFVRIFGFDFLGASAVSKVVNVACNVSALFWFWNSGHVLWQIGLMMGACNVLGSLVGSRLAIKHGSGFVRKLFLVVVLLLISKTSYDAFIR